MKKSMIFVARILPERIPVKIGEPISGSSTVEGLDFAYDFSLTIADSQVIADVSITRGEMDIFTLRNLIKDNIRVVTDLVGYTCGISFDVDVISVVDKNDDSKLFFGIGIPVLMERRQDHQKRALEADVLQIVASDVYAQIVLADFREAMKNPAGTGFFCFRAVEAMMQSMKIEEREKEERVWERLRENLRLDLSALKYLKGHADFPRHGKPTQITDAERAHVFEITDEIVRRYLENLRRGRVPLAEDEFPLLRR